MSIRHKKPHANKLWSNDLIIALRYTQNTHGQLVLPVILIML